MNKRTSYLSIKQWILVLLGVCFAQTTLHFTYLYYKDKQRPFDPVFDYIQEFLLNDNKNSKRVLFFGSSLIGQGLACPDDTIFNTNNTALPISIFKVWKSEDPFDELFSSEKYLKQIIELKPNLICIQTELAAVNLKWLGFETNFFKNISIENRGLKPLIFKQEKKDLDLITYCNPKNTIQVNENDTLNIDIGERFIKTQDEISKAFPVLKALKDAKIKMVIVDIPRPHSVERKFKTETYSNNLNRCLDEYKTVLNIDYWAYDGRKMNHADFMDRGHLNEIGKTSYSKWFLETLKTKTFN